MFRVSLAEFVIQRVKSYAVVYISRRNMDSHNEVILVAGRMRFIRHTFLVFAFVENSRFRIGRRDHGFLLTASAVLVPERRFVVILAVFVDLVEQLSGVSFGFDRYRLLRLLFQVGAGFDVRAVHKQGFRVKAAFFRCRFQHPAEHIFHRGGVEPVFEIVTHGGEMRDLLCQCVPDEPAVRHIHAHLFQCAPKRGDPVDVLNEYDFEQHHRVNAGSAVIFAVQFFHKVVDFVEFDRCFDLPQKVICRNQLLQYDKFHLPVQFFVFYQHFSSPPLSFLLLYYTKKGRPWRPFSTG